MRVVRRVGFYRMGELNKGDVVKSGPFLRLVFFFFNMEIGEMESRGNCS